MAYSTATLLPVLYDVGNDMEAFYKKQGPVVTFDGPNKAASIDYMSGIADRLQQYSRLCKSIEEQKNSQKRMCVTYFVIGLLLTIGAVLVPTGIWGWSLVQQEGPLRDRASGAACVMALIVLVVLLLVVMVNLFKRNRRFYNQLYDTSAITSDGSVADVVKQFVVKHAADDGTSMQVESNNPLMVFYYAQQHSDMQVDLVPKLNENQAVDMDWCEGAVSSDKQLGDFMQKCVPDDERGLVFPFTATSTYNPAVLRKKLQQLDMYGQLARLSTSTAWLKTFLAKASDDKYGGGGGDGAGSGGADVHAKVVQSLVALLRDNFAQVNDLVITGEAAAPQTATADQCVRMCVGSSDVVAVTFDPVTSTCCVATRDAIKAGTAKLSYSPGSGSTTVLYSAKPGTESIPVWAATIDTKFVADAFAPAAQGVCDVGVAGCLVPSTQTGWMSTKQALAPGTTYDQVFAGTGAAPVQLSYASRLADIVARNQTVTLDVALRDRKAAFVRVVADAILQVDSSGAFQLTQADMDAVVSAVRAMNDLAAAPLSDVLQDVPAELAQRYQDTQNTDSDASSLASYIPYERFLEKVTQMSGESFIVDFVANIEEVRSTSNGIRTLRNKYDGSHELHVQSVRLNEQVLVLSLVIALLLWLAYATHDYASLTGSGDGTASKQGQLALLDHEIGEHARQLLDAQHALTLALADANMDARGKARAEAVAKELQARVAQLQAMRRDVVVSTLFKHVVIIVIIAITFVVFRAMLKKRNAIYDYNYAVLEHNSATVYNDSRSVMQMLFDDMSLNRYGIKAVGGSANTSAAAELQRKQIVYDSSTTLDFNTGGVREDEYFDVIVKSSNVSEAVHVQPAADAAMYAIYLKLLRVVDASDKCNALNAGYEAGMPAPIMELFMYVVVLAVCIGVIAYIASRFRPMQCMAEVRRLLQAKRRLVGGASLPKEDYATLEGVDGPEHVSAMVIVKCTALVLLLVFTVMFGTQIDSQANRFVGALYASDAYRNNQCYKK